MGHYVYKYVLDGQVIYIGKCDKNLSQRLYAHGRKGDNISERWHKEINDSDIYYIECANAIMSDVVESELIRRYKPKCNKAKMSDWSGIPFSEPSWIKFERPVEWSRKRVKKTKTKRILKDYYDSNCESRQNLLYVIGKLKQGDYIDTLENKADAEGDIYGIDVTEIANDEDWFLNTRFMCCTHNRIAGINWESFLATHVDSGRKYVFVDPARLTNEMEEWSEILYLEEEKHMHVKVEGESE